MMFKILKLIFDFSSVIVQYSKWEQTREEYTIFKGIRSIHDPVSLIMSK